MCFWSLPYTLLQLFFFGSSTSFTGDTSRYVKEQVYRRSITSITSAYSGPRQAKACKQIVYGHERAISEFVVWPEGSQMNKASSSKI